MAILAVRRSGSKRIQEKLEIATSRWVERIKEMPWIPLSDALFMLRQQGIKLTGTTMIKRIRAGDVEGKMLGGRWFITQSAIDKMLAPPDGKDE
jgi:hypothetical protein